MLDIKLIRENPDLVKGDLIKRGEIEKLKWVDEILELDAKWRENLKKINQLRKERNQLAVQIGKRKKAGEPIDDLLARSNEIVRGIEALEREVDELRKRIDYYLWRLPNITHESVPVGKDDTENVPVRFWGKAKVWEGFLESFKEQSLGKMDYELLSWKPRLHVDMLELLKGADLERAAKVSGARFYYLMNELVILDLALIRFALDRLIEKGFTPVVPPTWCAGSWRRASRASTTSRTSSTRSRGGRTSTSSRRPSTRSRDFTPTRYSMERTCRSSTSA